MQLRVRDYDSGDAGAVNALVLAAWREYAQLFDDWPQSERFFANASCLAERAELILAELSGQIRGVVAFVPPGAPREDIFAPQWALIRMLSVAPEARGLGIGRRLSLECIERAWAAGAETLGLHTSPRLGHALELYRRLGFEQAYRIPDRNGLPYAVYTLARQRADSAQPGPGREPRT
jgi:ribosomal protein S18 acetylase RimI-like enzyme